MAPLFLAFWNKKQIPARRRICLQINHARRSSSCLFFLPTVSRVQRESEIARASLLLVFRLAPYPGGGGLDRGHDFLVSDPAPGDPAPGIQNCCASPRALFRGSFSLGGVVVSFSLGANRRV